MRLPLILLLLPVLVAAHAGCAGDEEGEEEEPRAVEDAPGKRDRAGVPADVHELGCNKQLEGGALEPGRDDLVVGPVTFFEAAHFSSEAGGYANRPPGAWGRAWKSVTRVEPEVAATVIIPAQYRDSLQLLYRRVPPSIQVNGHDTGWHPRSAGTAAVRFAACPALPPPRPDGPTRMRAFGGGFLVKEPGCYELKVVSDGDPSPHRATIGFAVGRKGCPASWLGAS